MLSSLEAEQPRHTKTPQARRLFYAYLVGLVLGFLSASIANRAGARHWNTLFSGFLGVSSALTELFGQHRLSVISMVLAAGLLSFVFVVAEFLRSRQSWLRWLGWVVWFLLALASLIWFVPPNI